MVCEFSEEYFDHIKGKEITYSCDEPTINGDYCIFHHPNYWRKHPEKISVELKKRIIQSGAKPLYFIGYNIPDVDFSGLNIRAPIYFTCANFHGEINFAQTVFHHLVDFSLAKFFNNIVFIKATFLTNIYFNFVIIHGDVDFRQTVFHKLLDFSNAEFKGKANFWASQYLGDADFSGSEFHDEVDFRLTIFNKKAIFDHTVFRYARFYGAKFVGPASFKYAQIGKSDFRHAVFYKGKDFSGATISEKIE